MPPTKTRPLKGTVSNTFADAYGVWHAEVEAAEGNGSAEVFGCPMRTIYNRAAKALTREIAARQSNQTPPVKVDYLGLRRRGDGTFYALFKERSN